MQSVITLLPLSFQNMQELPFPEGRELCNWHLYEESHESKRTTKRSKIIHSNPNQNLSCTKGKRNCMFIMLSWWILVNQIQKLFVYMWVRYWHRFLYGFSIVDTLSESICKICLEIMNFTNIANILLNLRIMMLKIPEWLKIIWKHTCSYINSRIVELMSM